MKKLPLVLLSALFLTVLFMGLGSAYHFNHHDNVDTERYYKTTTNYDYFNGGYAKTTARTSFKTTTYSYPTYSYRSYPRSSYSYDRFGDRRTFHQADYPRYRNSYHPHSHTERYYDNYYYRPSRYTAGSYYWRY